MSLISQIPTATTGYVELIHAVIIPFNTGLQSPALEEGQGRGMKKKKTGRVRGPRGRWAYEFQKGIKARQRGHDGQAECEIRDLRLEALLELAGNDL